MKASAPFCRYFQLNMRQEVFGIHCYHTSHAKLCQFGTCSYQNGLLVSWFALWRAEANSLYLWPTWCVFSSQSLTVRVRALMSFVISVMTFSAYSYCSFCILSVSAPRFFHPCVTLSYSKPDKFQCSMCVPSSLPSCVASQGRLCSLYIFLSSLSFFCGFLPQHSASYVSCRLGHHAVSLHSPIPAGRGVIFGAWP